MSRLLSKNIIIYGGTNALKSLVPLLMLPILTAYLSLEDFGTLSLVETTILFIVPFILLNINAAINVEYFKLEHRELKVYVTNALLISLISFSLFLIIFYLFNELLSNILNINKDLVVLMVIFSFLRVTGTVVLGLYQAKQEAKQFAIFTLFQTLIDFTLSYLFVVLFKFGYMGRLEGTYISFFIFSIVGIYILYKMDYLGKVSFTYTKDIVSFGIPLIPHAISGTVIAMSDRYFVSYYIGNNEVGIYTIAYQLSALMLLVGVSVNQAWTPVLFKLLKEKDIVKIYKYTFYLFILFIISAIGIYFLKDTLFYIFVDEKFYSAKEYFGYLLLGFFFQSLYFLVTNILFFEKRTKLLAAMTFFGAIVNLILNYFFIIEFGTIGVAYATAMTWGLYFLLVLLVNIKIMYNIT